MLQQLAKRMRGLGGSRRSREDEVAETMRLIQSKTAEKDRILALYRRGRIDDRTLDKQMDEIGAEEKDLRDRVEQLTAEMQGAQATEKKLESTADLLRELNRRLDEPLTWELKRQLVELLVEEVRVDTIEAEGKRETRVTVTYRFPASTAPITDHRDARADNNRSIVMIYSERRFRATRSDHPAPWDTDREAPDLPCLPNEFKQRGDPPRREGRLPTSVLD